LECVEIPKRRKWFWRKIRGGFDMFGVADVAEFRRMKRVIFGAVDDLPQRPPTRLQQRFVFARGEQNPAQAEVGLAAKGFIARVVNEHQQAIRRSTKWLPRQHFDHVLPLSEYVIMSFITY
jgi:hypothetical protein